MERACAVNQFTKLTPRRVGVHASLRLDTAWQLRGMCHARRCAAARCGSAMLSSACIFHVQSLQPLLRLHCPAQHYEPFATQVARPLRLWELARVVKINKIKKKSDVTPNPSGHRPQRPWYNS